MVVLRPAVKNPPNADSRPQPPPNGPHSSDFSQPPTPARMREPYPSQLIDTPSPPPFEPRRRIISTPPRDEPVSLVDNRYVKRKREHQKDEDPTQTEVNTSGTIAAEDSANFPNNNGKGKMVESLSLPNAAMGSTSRSSEVEPQVLPEWNVENRSSLAPQGQQPREVREGPRNRRMEQFRDIARSNASRFARFASDSNEPAQAEKLEEDWPGPFSSALKIIRDRTNKVPRQKQLESSGSKETSWTPKEKSYRSQRKIRVPTLQELSLKTLASHADAIDSLACVPDQMRNKLSNLLCKRRNMNGKFLGLLVEGSPSEIRLKDCSWLDEDTFLEHFKELDSSSLKVLQLDQCGRCIANYTLIPILSSSPCRFPNLRTLSLTGACRLSDSGVKSLVSSTPNITSLNISQCSLLTSDSITIICTALGKVLEELYINECEGMNAHKILPALNSMTQLQVLSLSGISSVNDAFIEGLVPQDHTFEELVLSNCPEISDASVKAIAKGCPGLRSLDLCFAVMLTDNALGYLANGCRVLETLKLCRNVFSDEAVAAYLEASGKRLKHLSLNSVRKVETNTAMALAKCGKTLSYLDVSWCRRLTDDMMGLVVDSCQSLKEIKIFGCSQLTDTFFNGYSNQQVRVVGATMTPIMFLEEEMS